MNNVSVVTNRNACRCNSVSVFIELLSSSSLLLPFSTVAVLDALRLVLSVSARRRGRQRQRPMLPSVSIHPFFCPDGPPPLTVSTPTLASVHPKPTAPACSAAPSEAVVASSTSAATPASTHLAAGRRPSAPRAPAVAAAPAQSFPPSPARTPARTSRASAAPAPASTSTSTHSASTTRPLVASAPAAAPAPASFVCDSSPKFIVASMWARASLAPLASDRRDGADLRDLAAEDGMLQIRHKICCASLLFLALSPPPHCRFFPLYPKGQVHTPAQIDLCPICYAVRLPGRNEHGIAAPVCAWARHDARALGGV
jgi:hypothetical protein